LSVVQRVDLQRSPSCPPEIQAILPESSRIRPRLAARLAPGKRGDEGALPTRIWKMTRSRETWNKGLRTVILETRSEHVF